MKLSRFLILVFVFGSLFTIAQANSVIESLTVNYKLPFTPTEDTANSGALNVLPEATVKLLTTENISKIYFKIINFSNNEIVYSVNYPIASQDILDSNGRLLFSKNNLILYLGGSVPVPLISYSYELITEDSEGNLSPIFSEIH